MSGSIQPDRVAATPLSKIEEGVEEGFKTFTKNIKVGDDEVKVTLYYSAGNEPDKSKLDEHFKDATTKVVALAKVFKLGNSDFTVLSWTSEAKFKYTGKKEINGNLSDFLRGKLKKHKNKPEKVASIKKVMELFNFVMAEPGTFELEVRESQDD